MVEYNYLYPNLSTLFSFGNGESSDILAGLETAKVENASRRFRHAGRSTPGIVPNIVTK